MVRLALLVALLTVLLAWDRSSPALQGLRVGLVHSARLTGEAERFSRLRNEYEERRRAYTELIHLRQSYLLLSGLEWAELRMLLSKTPRTNEDEKRLEELRKVETDREVVLQRLRQTPSGLLSPSDRATLEQLTRLWKDGRSDIEELKNLLDVELKRIEQEMGKEREEKLAKAIEKIASEQNLDLVIDRSVFYYARGSVVDITDEVVGALQSQSQQPSSPQPFGPAQGTEK